MGRKHLGGATKERERRERHRRDVEVGRVHVPRRRRVVASRDVLSCCRGMHLVVVFPDSSVGPAAEPGSGQEEHLGAAVGRRDREARSAADGG